MPCELAGNIAGRWSLCRPRLSRGAALATPRPPCAPPSAALAIVACWPSLFTTAATRRHLSACAPLHAPREPLPLATPAAPNVAREEERRVVSHVAAVTLTADVIEGATCITIGPPLDLPKIYENFRKPQHHKWSIRKVLVKKSAPGGPAGPFRTIIFYSLSLKTMSLPLSHILFPTSKNIKRYILTVRNKSEAFPALFRRLTGVFLLFQTHWAPEHRQRTKLLLQLLCHLWRNLGETV
ncbi:hypothetical protein C8R45DRAFT_937037 [Mycena sanguinolenta]|nr:hypothetical protein C8R45DRAFT_937037 [Mycena sanguinolenta]